METTILWDDKLPEVEDRSICYDIAFNPEGTQVVAAVGSRVLVYDALSGNLLHSLKAHHLPVYSVTYSSDGYRFASGGADNIVIVWTNKAEGSVKFSHNDSIQVLASNPISQELVSCTSSDFGLWSPFQKSVAKHKVNMRITSCCWSPDGQNLAMGFFNGQISIRDKSGNEKCWIDRDGIGGPIWSLAFSPVQDAVGDLLTVGQWDGYLCFYRTNGEQVGEDCHLEMDPCCISYSQRENVMMVAGTDGRVTAYAQGGYEMMTIINRGNWIWSVKITPDQKLAAIACNDGSIVVYKLNMSTACDVYQERYAYRENITDLLVASFNSDHRTRIKCKSYIKKISVYRNRIAVQLPTQIVIYEFYEQEQGTRYRVKASLFAEIDFAFLVVLSSHVVLCSGKKMQLMNFDGEIERRWNFDFDISCTKTLGGLTSKEVLAVGLESGQLHKVIVDNSVPLTLLKHGAAITSADFNVSKTKVALIDSKSRVVVYDLKTKHMIFEDENVESVAWNSVMEDMFCYSGPHDVKIRTIEFPISTVSVTGSIIEFRESKIFFLESGEVHTADVKQTSAVAQYAERKDFEKAYKVALFGLTATDWKRLALHALENRNFGVAKRSFHRLQDFLYTDLLQRIETQEQRTKNTKSIKNAKELCSVGEILAYQGYFQEAARAFAKDDRIDKAIEMFSDLKQLDQARIWSQSYSKTKGLEENVRELIIRQAQWSEETNDLFVAADMYSELKQYDKAVSILRQQKAYDRIAKIVRLLPKTDVANLKLCAKALQNSNRLDYCREVFQKLGDWPSLGKLFADHEMWEEAFTLAGTYSELENVIFLPYANWLVARDRFEEARASFTKAGRPELGISLLKQLCNNAIIEKRYSDASKYYWQLAMVSGEDTSYNEASSIANLINTSEIYYAYGIVYWNVDKPFARALPTTVFQAARYLLSKLQTPGAQIPVGVSMPTILFAIATYGQLLGAFKLTRYALNRLQSFHLPKHWIEEIELSTLLIRTKPYADDEELVPVCSRCQTINQLLSFQEHEKCTNCGNEFVRSMLTFDLLPLIEFRLAEGISDEEALKYIREDPESEKKNRRSSSATSRAEAGSEILMVDDPEHGELHFREHFTQIMTTSDSEVVVNAEVLRSFSPSDILIRRFPLKTALTKYYKIADEKSKLIVGASGHVYESEEFHIYILENNGKDPFTKEKNGKDGQPENAKRFVLDDFKSKRL